MLAASSIFSKRFQRSRSVLVLRFCTPEYTGIRGDTHRNEGYIRFRVFASLVKEGFTLLDVTRLMVEPARTGEDEDHPVPSADNVLCYFACSLLQCLALAATWTTVLNTTPRRRLLQRRSEWRPHMFCVSALLVSWLHTIYYQFLRRL